MAENGTIVTTTTTTNGNPGTVRRDDIPGTPVIDYVNPSNFNLVKDNKVTINVDDFSGPEPIATILSVVVAPTEPPDEGDKKTGTVTGFTVSAGQTVTVAGATVNGDINVDGGKLIIKTNSTIKGSVDARNGNAEVLFYNSTIEKSLLFRNSSQAVTINNGSVGGDVDIRNAAKGTGNNGTVGGDVDIRNVSNGVTFNGFTLTGSGKQLDIRNNSGNTEVKDITVNDGDVVIKNNQGCSYSNITVPNGNMDIDGCTLVP